MDIKPLDIKPLVTIKWKEIENDKVIDCHLDLREPSTYSGGTSTMVDNGTSVSGKFLGSVIRNDVAQISMSWNYLEAKDWTDINKPFKLHYINKVSFFDQTTGDWVTDRDMYISNISASMSRRDSDGNVLGWTGCSLQLSGV